MRDAAAQRAEAGLRAEAPRLSTALEFLAEAIRRGLALDDHVTLYDPVPSAMPRRAGHERAQLLVQSVSRTRLRRFLVSWSRILRETRPLRARWALDVDPYDF